MFNWDGCPIGLFDIYMEVGQVRVVEPLMDGCVTVEVWAADCFTKTHLRPELENIARRPIYGILKQILKLSGENRVCLIFQCDDEDSHVGNDTENWSCSIYLLLRELQKLDRLACSILFTKKTREQIRERSRGHFFHYGDQENYEALYQMLDILVTRQANRFAPSKGREIFCRNEALLRNLPGFPDTCAIL